jgi:hypothetical protein
VNSILGTSYTTDDALLGYMRSNKTEVALRFHDTTTPVKWPKYIEDAIDAIAK